MICSTSEQSVPASLIIGIIKSVKHATQHIDFFKQHGQGFTGVNCGAPAAFAGRVFFHRGFQLITNTNIVHDQAAFLIPKYPINACNSLHQVMPPHGRSEEHTSELQSRGHLVCRLLLEKKKKKILISLSE